MAYQSKPKFTFVVGSVAFALCVCRGWWDKPPSEGGSPPLKVTIHRSSLLQDGWAALHMEGQSLKGRLVVSFINEQGMLEAGLDYGGLVKEFLEQVK